MRNLDPRFYVDPAVYRSEQERVFWRAWQLLGPASQVAKAGDYVAAEIAGAKVVAIRGDDGVLRAFRNVCVHRGARLLEEGTGHCSAIQCPYHRWLYGLDGTLKRTPWFGEAPRLRHGRLAVAIDQRRRMARSAVRRHRSHRVTGGEPRRHRQGSRR